ncbi:hypothetical protein [Shewanella sp. MEBiC00475]|uniref:hypothetical protein n=1 Tax=Shewanella sp. MEBiC00475 TaxID=2575361 RepID=UPI0010C0F04B|nr:hypothetical protein [Shewanella sp. MEBiC00475]
MFFVFGVSETLVKKAADKKCSKFVNSYPNKRELTPDEYQQKLIITREELFKKMKPQKLSHSLSTPSLAKQYSELTKAQEMCRDIEIRYRKPTGTINPKTKKEVLEWATYIC